LTSELGGSLYQDIGLRSGVTITQIRALVYDVASNSGNDNGHIKVMLKKLQMNDEPAIVEVGSAKQSTNTGYQVISLSFEEPIEWSDTTYPPSYFIEVLFSNGGDSLRLYSVTIDYEYTAP
jgi:hypothetical protein